MNNLSKCILEIDLAAIASNYDILKKTCDGAVIGSVVKSNAYGLGALQVTKILENKGCNNFFVATTEEGVKLRKILNKESNIYILYGVFTDNTRVLIKNNLLPVINHLGQLEIWKKLANSLQKKLPLILHCDTGMNRLGMNQQEFKKLVANPDLYENLDTTLIMSHLSSSEDINSYVNESQLKLFRQLSAHFPKIKRSFANSSGIFLGKDYHFDLARPGAAIYGINPTPYNNSNPMLNTVKLTAPIIQISKIASGSDIGYNCTFRTQRSCAIATIPLGYGDGFSRAFSNNGLVYINDKPAPIVGRVSMDLVTIDVTNFSENEVYLGQRVEVIGPNIPLDKIAKLSGTISYEILTTLGDRFKRIYNKTLII